MNNKLDVLEDSLLKLFRIAMLTLMILALLLVLIFGGVAAYQAMQSPKEPAPVQTAPEKEIKLDDLKKALQEDARKDQQDQKKTEEKPVSQVPNSLQYLEETTALYRCVLDFARQTDAQVADEGNAVANQKVEALRSQIEERAKGSERGDVWVKSAVQFTCAALGDKEIIAWKKEKKINNVFFPTLNFHIRMWDSIRQERREFAEKERARFDSEKNAEETRVGLARAQALILLYMAGVAFGVFMVLAFYLLFSRIERNLRPENIRIVAP